MSIIQAIPHPTVKLEKYNAVIQGLQRGELYQQGGVIRKAFPPSEKGQIFAHLYQTGEAPLNHTVQWGKGIQTASNFAMAATALSAINIGVSVVGFAIMAKKLNRLQRSVEQLENTVKVGFEQVNSRLDNIEYRMNGLYDLQKHTQVKQEIHFRKLQEQVDWTVFSKLFSSFESLSDIESGRSSGYSPGIIAERIRESRVYIKSQLQSSSWRESTEWDAEILRTRLLMLLYQQSLVAEAYAWRLSDETETSMRLLQREVEDVHTMVQDFSMWSLNDMPSRLGLLDDWDMKSIHQLSWARCVLNHPERSCSALALFAQNQYFKQISHDFSLSLHPEEREYSLQKALIAESLCTPLMEGLDSLVSLKDEYIYLVDQGLGWASWEGQQIKSEKAQLVIY